MCFAPGILNENCECVLTSPEFYLGCTDQEACNYDNCAFIDDGSCCSGYCIEVTLTNGWGDGWNGSTLTILDLAGNAVAVVGEEFTGDWIDYSCSDYPGYCYSETVCLPEGCYDIYAGPNSLLQVGQCPGSMMAQVRARVEFQRTIHLTYMTSTWATPIVTKKAAPIPLRATTTPKPTWMTVPASTPVRDAPTAALPITTPMPQ